MNRNEAREYVNDLVNYIDLLACIEANKAVKHYCEANGVYAYKDNWVLFSHGHREFERLSALNDIAVAGRVSFVRFIDSKRSEAGGTDYESKVINDPTWLEVCRFAQESVNVTKNPTEASLRGIRMVGLRLKGVTEYEFVFE